MDKLAVYPGTFDPVTNGHIDIIKRGKTIFSKVIVAVAENPKKNTLFTVDERVGLIKKVTKGLQNISVEAFDGLLVDYVKQKKAHAIIRGVRAISDFDYEFQMALMNRKLVNNIETVFMIPNEIYSFLSSSLVREIASYNGNIDELVPSFVSKKLKEKFKK